MEIKSTAFSDPPTVHDEALLGTHAAVVGGQPQRHTRHVGPVEPARQRLALGDLPLAVGCEPQPDLAFGHDPARCDAVDAYALRGAKTKRPGSPFGKPGR